MVGVKTGALHPPCQQKIWIRYNEVSVRFKLDIIYMKRICAAKFTWIVMLSWVESKCVEWAAFIAWSDLNKVACVSVRRA